MRKNHSFFYRNGLSIFALGFFFIFLTAQALTGLQVYNEFLIKENASPISLPSYLKTGDFLEITFENWESEFLQMFLYVLFTVWLRQWGSSESKSLDKAEDVDAEPVAGPDAPWPVRRGGIVLKLYKNSLSIAFFILFLLSFIFHALGSYKNYVSEQLLEGGEIKDLPDYMLGAQFWFESFQNWQSEFLAIASIVVLSIFLRQQGSPESKPVDMPHNDIP